MDFDALTALALLGAFVFRVIHGRQVRRVSDFANLGQDFWSQEIGERARGLCRPSASRAPARGRASGTPFRFDRGRFLLHPPRANELRR
jgi:hypothetical protein